MPFRHDIRWWATLLLLCALAACSSSSTTTAPPICRHGVDDSIYLHLDALARTLPLDIRTCIQHQPCTEGQTDGRDKYGQPRFAFPFTLDDHHQQITVPVTVLITSNGNQIAEGTVGVPVLQDYATDASSGKTANCGGTGSIAVTRQGQLRVLPPGSN